MLNLLSNRRGLKSTKAKQIEDLQDGVKGATSFHQTKYPKNNPQKANSSAKEEKRLKPRRKDDSNSDDSNHKSSGWFSDQQVTSFQYDEQDAWYQG
jgi:hypothetical protein